MPENNEPAKEAPPPFSVEEAFKNLNAEINNLKEQLKASSDSLVKIREESNAEIGKIRDEFKKTSFNSPQNPPIPDDTPLDLQQYALDLFKPLNKKA